MGFPARNSGISVPSTHRAMEANHDYALWQTLGTGAFALASRPSLSDAPQKGDPKMVPKLTQTSQKSIEIHNHPWKIPRKFPNLTQLWPQESSPVFFSLGHWTVYVEWFVALVVAAADTRLHRDFISQNLGYCHFFLQPQMMGMRLTIVGLILIYNIYT